MRISIVMTYFNRRLQLINTLESFQKYDPQDFNVIIVDDNSPEDIILPALDFDVEIIKLTTRKTVSSGPAYNEGFLKALQSTPDIIIIQNAECYHATDIISKAKEVNNKTYIAFSCYSLAQGETPETVVRNDRIALFNGDSAWYNHPEFRPVGFHFCSAITAENLKRINGFDERFMYGIDYDDNYLIHQVRTMGLEVIIPADYFVYHQFHYNVPRPLDGFNNLRNNVDLYNELILKNEFRAVHLITPDL